MRTYDKLIDEDPDVKERLAQSEARGEARGIAIGEIKGKQNIVLAIIETRFPSLLETVQDQVTQVTDESTLISLVKLIGNAPDEATARWVLMTLVGRVRTYDKLIDEDLDVQQRIARGKIEAQQKLVLTLIEVRFPSLQKTAQEQIVHITETDDLIKVTKLIAVISDESIISKMLNVFAS